MNLNSNKDKKTNSNKLLIAPIVCSILSFIVISLAYIYEKNITKDILISEKRAEDLALSGNLYEALNIVKKNIKKRPNYTSIQTDLEFLINGIEVNNKIDKIKYLNKEKKHDEAIKMATDLENQLSSSTGSFYSMLKNNVTVLKESLIVDKIRPNIQNKYNINELIPYYTKVYKMETQEGQLLLDDIKKEISRIAYANATFYLNQKKFDKALKELNNALKYDQDNQKLLSFKYIIERKKYSYIRRGFNK